MKTSWIKIGIASLLSISAIAMAQTEDDLSKDFNSLGNNKEIVRRARMLDPENRVRIVQNRMVDRRWRLEVGAHAGTVAGGDSFVESNNVGATMDFHITPHWSIGARYYQSMNTLTSQGEEAYRKGKEAIAMGSALGDTKVPEVNWPEKTLIGTVAWYPIYGKLNLFDLSVAQFDVYTLLGAGTVEVNRMYVDRKVYPTFTVGGGVGVWMSQHFSTRFEARYQRYSDEMGADNHKRDLDLMVLGVSFGFIL